MIRIILSIIALPLSIVVALPSLAQADQLGFPDSRRKLQRTQTIGSTDRVTNTTFATGVAEPTVVVDKTSGRYLQSVGKRVADRPLACPPRSKRK